jgi:hypothetical protein
MLCSHKIRFGTVSESDGGYDAMDGSTIIDATCDKCGRSGSMRLTAQDLVFDDDEATPE